MRVPKRLHAELAHAAKSQGVSLNQYVLYLLTSFCRETACCSSLSGFAQLKMQHFFRQRKGEIEKIMSFATETN